MNSFKKLVIFSCFLCSSLQAATVSNLDKLQEPALIPTILQHAQINDVLAFSQTCKAFYALIMDDPHLWAAHANADTNGHPYTFHLEPVKARAYHEYIIGRVLLSRLDLSQPLDGTQQGTLQTALTHLVFAADHGILDAQRKIGNLYRNGHLKHRIRSSQTLPVANDQEEVSEIESTIESLNRDLMLFSACPSLLQTLNQAARNDHPMAVVFLKAFYKANASQYLPDTNVLPEDEVETLSTGLIQALQKKKDPTPLELLCLSVCYEQGLGVNLVDLKEAQRLCLQAMRAGKLAKAGQSYIEDRVDEITKDDSTTQRENDCHAVIQEYLDIFGPRQEALENIAKFLRLSANHRDLDRAAYFKHLRLETGNEEAVRQELNDLTHGLHVRYPQDTTIAMGGYPGISYPIIRQLLRQNPRNGDALMMLARATSLARYLSTPLLTLDNDQFADVTALKQAAQARIGEATEIFEEQRHLEGEIGAQALFRLQEIYLGDLGDYAPRNTESYVTILKEYCCKVRLPHIYNEIAGIYRNELSNLDKAMYWYGQAFEHFQDEEARVAIEEIRHEQEKQRNEREFFDSFIGLFEEGNAPEPATAA